MQFLDNNLIPKHLVKEVDIDLNKKIFILGQGSRFNPYTEEKESENDDNKSKVIGLKGVDMLWTTFVMTHQVYLKNYILKHFKKIFLIKASKDGIYTLKYDDGEFNLDGKIISNTSVKFTKTFGGVSKKKKSYGKKVEPKPEKTIEFKYTRIEINGDKINLDMRNVSEFEIKLICISSNQKALEFMDMYQKSVDSYIKEKKYLHTNFDKFDIFSSEYVKKTFNYAPTYILDHTDLSDENKKFFISPKNIIINDYLEKQDKFSTERWSLKSYFMIDYFKEISNFIGNKNLRDMYWIDPKVKKYVLKPEKSYDSIMVNATSFKNKIMNILGKDLYSILYEKKYLIGGSVLACILTGQDTFNDVDIFINDKSLSKVVLNITKKALENKTPELFTLEQMSQTRVCYSKNVSDKTRKFEIFSMVGNPIRFVESFHLPIVRAYYDIHNDILYCHQSFIRALLTKTNYIDDREDRFFNSKSTKEEIIDKYMNRGWGFLVNESSKESAAKKLKHKYTIEEIKDNMLPDFNVSCSNVYIQSDYVFDRNEKFNKYKEIRKKRQELWEKRHEMRGKMKGKRVMLDEVKLNELSKLNEKTIQYTSDMLSCSPPIKGKIDKLYSPPPQILSDEVVGKKEVEPKISPDKVLKALESEAKEKNVKQDFSPIDANALLRELEKSNDEKKEDVKSVKPSINSDELLNTLHKKILEEDDTDKKAEKILENIKDVMNKMFSKDVIKNLLNEQKK